MQEVIQERKACRNVFEVMDFICVDYNSYLKSRLVSLATKRCTYRNAFGLKTMALSPGIFSITRLGQSTFEVLQERLSGNDCKATVEMRSGACSHCELSKFCVHVSAVACLYPESMVSMYFIIITETSVCREWTCR